MSTHSSIETLAGHAAIWSRVQKVLDSARLPHAFLFIGPRHAGIVQFANRLIALLLCQNITSPCGHCPACHLLHLGTHPDVQYLYPVTPGGPIKIEQIRALQRDVYQTPQRGERRFIVIEPADKLNSSAANALLKVLEEPPAHTMFMLIAEHISSLPATIMSRCQHYVFTAPVIFTQHELSESINQREYLALGRLYSEASTRTELFKKQDAMIESLGALMDKKISPCSIAAQWSVYAFEDILWFLYLFTAQALHYQLVEGKLTSAQNDILATLFRSLQPVHLFKQLDQINLFIKKTQKNITLNQTLAVEVLLLGYLGG